MTEKGGRSARSTGLVLSVVLLVAGCAESERSPPGGEFTERVENGVVIAENGPLDAAPALGLGSGPITSWGSSGMTWAWSPLCCTHCEGSPPCFHEAASGLTVRTPEPSIGSSDPGER